MVGYPLTSQEGETADTANLAMSGKINSVGSITLTANAATSTLTNYFLGPDSAVFFDPTTANAATEIFGGTMYVLTANRGEGSWTITHANNANADRTFRYVILG